MPVPRVMTSSVPLPSITARPCTPASLATRAGRLVASRSASARGNPAHIDPRLGAVWTMPSTTTPGKPAATRSKGGIWPAISRTVAITATGSAGCGVGRRTRSAVGWPSSSTVMPLMPVPPGWRQKGMIGFPCAINDPSPPLCIQSGRADRCRQWLSYHTAGPAKGGESKEAPPLPTPRLARRIRSAKDDTREAMPTMRAAVLTGYGGVERLELREGSRPEAGSGQLLVRVRAAGVNPIDWNIRQGRLRLLLPARLPLVLGFDVAGEVAAVGPEVADFEPGYPVYAMLDSRHGGGYAEYAVTGEATAAAKPETLSWEEAAAMPVAALTAMQALRDLAGLERGQRVAIVGAAGGVGHFAVQLAAATRAHVTAGARPDHQDFARRLGAERAVDYTREDFTVLEPAAAPLQAVDAADRLAAEGPGELGDDPESYEVIFDAAGAYDFATCEPALTPGGIYITTQPGPAIFIARLRASLSRLVDRQGAHRAATLRTRPRGDDLAALAELVAAGRLRPAIDRVFPFAEVRQAHTASEAGHLKGKIVLSIDAPLGPVAV